MSQNNSSKHDSSIIIKQQKVIIVRLLNEISVMNNNGSNLIESFKHFNILLMELKKNNDSPKEYYKLYIEVYECLTILLNYLKGNHLKLFHLTDIYELIQYSNNLVPRLYLMITCGVAMLHIDDFPHIEILKDMIEMLNGVQNPIKGMFLRYYLLQRSKFIFKNEESESKEKYNNINTEFKVDFLIANFIEMNKLWIRLQYQGQFKEKLTKLKERKEVELLIGYNLVQLTEVLDTEEEKVAIVLYRENALPRILKQIVSCRDIISQEYLLDIIIHIFPEPYHSDLKSIELYLETFLKLSPKTNISKNAISLISRILSYGDSTREDNLNCVDLEGELIFSKFFMFLKLLNEERPDLPFKEFLVVILELVKLVLQLKNEDDVVVTYLSQIFSFINFKIKDYNITEELNFLLKKIVFSLKGMDKENLYYKLATESNEFHEFIVSLNNDYIKYEILELIISSTKPNIESFSIKNLSKILRFFENNSYVILQKSDLVLRCFYFIVSVKVKYNEDLEGSVNSQFEGLQFCKNWLLSIRASFSKPEQQLKVDLLINGLINQYWKLVKKLSILKIKTPKTFKNLDKTLFQQIFKSLSNLIFELKNKKYLLTSLILSANMAIQIFLLDIANDYIESVIQQLNSGLSTNDKHDILFLLIEYLQKERKIYYDNNFKEKYEQLAIKLTFISFDLSNVFLKSNCLLACTNLWWTGVSDQCASQQSVENNPKRIYEVINRLIKYITSNNLITNYELCYVLLEVLNKVVYFFIHGEIEYFTINYINNIFKLLKNNLRFLERENKVFLEQQQESFNEENAIDQLSTENMFLDSDGNIKMVDDCRCEGTAYKTINIDEEKSLVAFKKNLLVFKNFETLKEYIIDQGEVDERFNLLNI
ncbi:hypothetical protein QEN19_003562 [Hanseniaspora menglaensis]